MASHIGGDNPPRAMREVSGTLAGRSDNQTAVSRTAALMRERNCNTAFVWI